MHLWDNMLYIYHQTGATKSVYALYEVAILIKSFNLSLGIRNINDFRSDGQNESLIPNMSPNRAQ